jgi:hypothetical protein
MNFWSFIADSAIGGTIIALIIFALKNYIKSVTQNYFNKNIENHKHELTKALKEIEFDYQRRMEDFTLYTQKRHHIYAELYKMLSKAVVEIKYATAIYRQYPIPQSYHINFEDLKNTLSKNSFNEEEIQSVINKWKIDPQKGQKEACRIIDSKRLAEADKLRVEAYNFFLINELYLNETLSKTIKEALDIMYEMVLDESMSIQYPEDTDMSNKKWTQHKENSEKLTNRIEQIKKIMKEELSIGDYAPERHTEQSVTQPY